MAVKENEVFREQTQVMKSTKFIHDFLEITEHEDDPLSAIIKITMAQFIAKSASEVKKKSLINQRLLSANEILDISIEELRNCIIDWTKNLQLDHLGTLQ